MARSSSEASGRRSLPLDVLTMGANYVRRLQLSAVIAQGGRPDGDDGWILEKGLPLRGLPIGMMMAEIVVALADLHDLDEEARLAALSALLRVTDVLPLADPGDRDVLRQLLSAHEDTIDQMLVGGPGGPMMVRDTQEEFAWGAVLGNRIAYAAELQVMRGRPEPEPDADLVEAFCRVMIATLDEAGRRTPVPPVDHPIRFYPRKDWPETPFRPRGNAR